MYDLIVVGGGPAGLTAAVYALRKRLNALLVSKDLGGKTKYRLALPWIEDYQVIRGLEVINKFKSELEYLDFARHMEPVEKITCHEDQDGQYFKVETRGGGELSTRAVILATGAKQQLLNVPGEKEYMMRGLCYSALSYAPLFIDKKTVVIGDDELAFRAAAELSTVANQVTLVRSKEDIPFSPLYDKLARSENVSILNGHSVVEVHGDDFAKKVLVKDRQGKITEVEADGTFIEKGLTPLARMVEGLVEMDESGAVKIDNRNATSVPGIFAAGDVTQGYAEQVLISVGEGAKAALSAYEYLLPML